jgi:hypothetical protein
MAQSIKKVGNTTLEILFKPGTYRENHEYRNNKILNRSIIFTPSKMTSDLLNDREKFLTSCGVNSAEFGPDRKYYYFGLKSGLQKLFLSIGKGIEQGNELTLLKGLHEISDKWKEDNGNKLLLLCSHIIFVGTSFHANAIYEKVLVSSVSKDLINDLSMRTTCQMQE